ncbi:hypothetical protein [Flavilitoribacter nigricans]|uniref:Uncharacterized protein n=1 Tax=Flavilitoribacter nigricans (strain ATCC 23147 / DSM 23189 / NBRC 102662 / NCIMB 1420 / SS-2) TaxID=1122177 RepID=A0A2D0N4J2_FLAN2|nr:hypothetical protein [Flavilitoribacter nigricans]PHN03308.1 hypothetical protein CRP01_28360 [Flavilitoribacter nigricans DSM 23189 = NBRC 102662]
MKQLLSLACMGVLCLLLSSQQANAQVSRKGGKDQPKVVLKKDKNETSETEPRNERTRTGTSTDRTSTPSRTETGGRTYPDRRQEPTTTRREPSTRQDRKRYPETENRYPRTERRYPYPTGDRTKRDQRGDRAVNGRSHGDYHDEHCDHPGKGRHLGWHKNKNKHKKGKGKGKGGKH